MSVCLCVWRFRAEMFKKKQQHPFSAPCTHKAPNPAPARSRLRAIDLLLERWASTGLEKQASAQQFSSCFPSLNDAFHYTVPNVNILFTYTHPAGLLKADQRAPSDERATFSAETNLISICFRVCVCACLCVPFLPVQEGQCC